MKSALRLLLLTSAVAAVASLAACNRDREKEAEPAVSTDTAATITLPDAGSNLNYESKTPWANVKLTLPDAVKGQPDLHARLYAEEVRKLRQFAEGAQGEHAEAGGEGLPVFENTITVSAAAETGKLLSLKRTAFDFSGGANPNTLTSSILWDKAMKRQIGLSELFARGADLTPLDQALCSAINTAKRARVPDSASITFDSKGYACPRAADTPFVLAGGTAQGKAGGLVFLIDPYRVGPRVEGAYELAIPAAVFRSLLAPAYVGEFGGQLTKAGDVTKAAG